MKDRDALRGMLKQADPARYLQLEQLASLEARIMEQVAITPQHSSATPEYSSPSLVAGFPTLSLWRGALMACLLLMFGVFTGQNLQASLNYQAAVSTNAIEAMSTPWHKWIDGKELSYNDR